MRDFRGRLAKSIQEPYLPRSVLNQRATISLYVRTESFVNDYEWVYHLFLSHQPDLILSIGMRRERRTPKPGYLAND